MNCKVQIVCAGPEVLDEHDRVPMYVDVCTRLRVERITGGLGGIRLTEEAVVPSYRKSYQDPTDAPPTWAKRWDLSTWGFFMARDQGQVIGGAVVAYRTAGIYLLDQREDVAVLWDIRVHPDYQRDGIGTALFAKTKAFSVERECKLLKIETQNVNVPACRFYSRQGCYLGGIREHAYKDFPEEVELLWFLEL
jgi:ribosomal protein S18 acetylase RimI-like enzyme